MRRIVIFLVLCLSLFSCHRQKEEPVLNELPSVDTMYSSRDMFERHLQEIWASDSITVSRSEWREMKDALHPDSVIEEMNGMLERDTPMGIVFKAIGGAMFIMIALAVLLFCLDLLGESVRLVYSRFFRCEKKDELKGKKQGVLKDSAASGSFGKPEQEFPEHTPEYVRTEVYEEIALPLGMVKARIKPPFAWEDNRIFDIHGHVVAFFEGVSLATHIKTRILNLLNEVPGESKFPAETFYLISDSNPYRLYVSQSSGYFDFVEYVDDCLRSELYLVSVKDYFLSHLQEDGVALSSKESQSFLLPPEDEDAFQEMEMPEFEEAKPELSSGDSGKTQSVVDAPDWMTAAGIIPPFHGSCMGIGVSLFDSQDKRIAWTNYAMPKGCQEIPCRNIRTQLVCQRCYILESNGC